METPPASSALTGRVIGHWKLGRMLGQGAFGAVYEAENTVVQGRTAAIKVLHRDMAENEDVRRRFINEASAASRADHENIIQVFDGGTTDDGLCYLIIELLKGTPLSAVIARGHIEPARALRIAVQIARGLASAHKAGIVHRDLKPDNVFVIRRDAEEDFVKVLDFGVAQLQFSRTTLAGVAIGTPAYMSPEQWEAKGGVDGRSDIYALGIILFEMLGGRGPFEATNDYGWLMAHTTAPVPLEPLADVPPEVRALVLHLLAKRREQRPQTMDEVVRALDAAIALLQPAETFTFRAPDAQPAAAGASASSAPAPQNDRWVVEVTALGAGGGRREVPVPRSGELTIGARKGNLIRLDGAGVAPWHARLVRHGGQFFVEEREHGKGLLLNGHPVEYRAPLAAGDVIHAGDFELRLRPAGAASSAPSTSGMRRAMVALVMLLLLVGGGMGALRLRAETRAREAGQQLARLSVEADRALKARDWDGAIARADEGLRLSFSDDGLRDKRALALGEQAAKPRFEAFLAAARGREWDRAVEGFKAIPERSVYRRDAQAQWDEVLSGYVELHVEKARALQQAGRCAEALGEVAGVLALDDGNSAAQDLAKACSAPPPPPAAVPPAPPAPASGAAKTGRHTSSKSGKGASKRIAPRR